MTTLADGFDRLMQLRVKAFLVEILITPLKGKLHDDVVGQALEGVPEREDLSVVAIGADAGAQLGDQAAQGGFEGDDAVGGEIGLEGAAAGAVAVVGDGAEGGVGVVELVDEGGRFVPAAVRGVDAVVKGRVGDVHFPRPDAHQRAVPPVQPLQLEQELPAPDHVEVGFVIDRQRREPRARHLR